VQFAKNISILLMSQKPSPLFFLRAFAPRFIWWRDASAHTDHVTGLVRPSVRLSVWPIKLLL